MSTQTIHEDATHIRTAATTDPKLEVGVIPVPDVDRTRRFYESRSSIGATTKYQFDCSPSGSQRTLRPSVGLSAMNVSSTPRAIDILAIPNVMSRVFVVDDEVSVRESLELLMGAEGWRVETFACAADFMSRPRAPVPCCLLLDVRLPGLSGLELQRQLADRTDIPIIFITGYGDVPTTVRAMKAGAFDFLTKPLKNDVLLAAIHHALERSRAALLHEAEMQALRTRYASLTPRERDVMALVVSGLLNKQVGGELGISEITVKAHRGQVMRKMKADSLPALVTMAARLGMRAAATH